MTTSFKAMDVVDNTPGQSIINGPARILGEGEIHRRPVVWLIKLPGASTSSPTRGQSYVGAPTYMPLAEFQDHLDQNRLHILNLAPDPVAAGVNPTLCAGEESDLIAEASTSLVA